ncbi:AAA family ATPase [Pleurostoma richardsiae]|uniref:AAA family ATPase n=1 Tax=Pleurostoma richardsiae TaxID=41990 RepID=A0AA38S7A1_9PEZI|nr:AAA family ATPase [Pleurostoma richardsiae]
MWTDDEEDQLYGAGERFMIDYVTYKQLHSDPQTLKKAFPHLNVRDRKEISPEMMELDEPPPFPEGLVFPPTIIGYNLRQKKWLDLKVDRIHNANWNEDAFEHLVVDNETKVLIRALISSKVEADQGTDVIGGKGNGLIILLHGGPGTGKTFTAESVAEIARKPLYRVTCGDIGTKPQEVEKYLESVLYLGKIWDCVVLLDEADVFLEQRTLMDLERNALVSVFLRVLEYYEGILILTSNRVGTFDEAFKSRIQLSLHYEALTKSQRSTIWKNFITRLKTLETSAAQKSVESGNINNSERLTPEISNTQQLPSIDYGDIERHIEELAKLKMNGRQIRNIITTGRQLAKYERVQMSFSHLKRVIKVSSKFDDYLKKVTGNTDEEAAREDGRR